MPVFRVERNKGYTVMSNYHLRDKSLSLKAKGLLSQILSLPEDWDYTLSGLCYINRECKGEYRAVQIVCYYHVVYQNRVNADAYHNEEALKTDSEQGF